MNASIRQADDAAIRGLLENWAKAVRDKDYSGILARHSADILMFDVPPPMESKGIEAYRKTWDLFFSLQPDPIDFDVQHMDVIAGEDVAFVAALMRCTERGTNGQRTALEFRLTVGLRKVSGEWVVVHEHHSVPAA
jgi:uncharacterized protein (TIGR02246 family)